MLNADIKKEDGVLQVTLTGRLDTLTSPVFEKQLEPELEDAVGVEFDFTGLEYISSAGLRILLAVQQLLEERGGQTVRVKNPNETIRYTFDITGFADILDIE